MKTWVVFSHIPRGSTFLTNVKSAHCPHLRPCEYISIGYARPRLQLPPGIGFFLPTLVQVLSSGINRVTILRCGESGEYALI